MLNPTTGPPKSRDARTPAPWKPADDATACLAEKILIVDPDIHSAESLASMLRKRGYPDVRVAYSGAAALAIAAHFRPSMVMLEIELMDMDGCDLARSLREQAQSEKVRLIALTFRREHGDRELAREAGFERYLLKPVTPAELQRVLELRAR
jgi:DNA-binding response OmpR family regulator